MMDELLSEELNGSFQADGDGTIILDLPTSEEIPHVPNLDEIGESLPDIQDVSMTGDSEMEDTSSKYKLLC